MKPPRQPLPSPPERRAWLGLLSLGLLSLAGCATPRPTPIAGVSLTSPGRGQRVSLERGVATRSKKNPGKRSKKGG